MAQTQRFIETALSDSIAGVKTWHEKCPKHGTVQKRPFLGNTQPFARTLILAPRERVRGWHGALGSLISPKPGVPQKFQPMSVRLTRQ
jgi:hypothetical protein